VFGLEGDIDWSNMRGSFTNVACPAGCETKNNWFSTVRGRLGYAAGRVMPYVTGGLAVGDIETKVGGLPAPAPPAPAGPSAAVSRQRCSATSPASSNISMPISAASAAARRRAAHRPTSTSAPTSCAPASTCASDRRVRATSITAHQVQPNGGPVQSRFI
jgi:hypothetical protein